MTNPNGDSSNIWACATCHKVACTCTIYSPGDLNQGDNADDWGLACASCHKVVCTCSLYNGPSDLTPNAGTNRPHR